MNDAGEYPPLAPCSRSPCSPGAHQNGNGSRLDLRQLRYFITLAEELHFGRAAAREHIVQSALSQQLQRLERALGVMLLDRSTRRIALTAAGRRFLVEARQILDHVDRATEVARHAARSAPVLRIGVADDSYATLRPILVELERQHPNLEIHQVWAGVPEQFRLLADGRLDAGIGLASPAPPDVASELVRLDPVGVLVPEGHLFAGSSAVPVRKLAGEPLLLADEQHAPESNQLLVGMCRSSGFLPTVHRGTVQGLRAAVDLVAQKRCLVCVPASSLPPTAGVVWRPLVAPAVHYPWSMLWRAGNEAAQVSALVRCARDQVREQGWLEHVTERAG